MFQHAGAPVRVSTNLVTTLSAKVCVFRAFRQETNAKNVITALILFLDFDLKAFQTHLEFLYNMRLYYIRFKFFSY